MDAHPIFQERDDQILSLHLASGARVRALALSSSMGR
jgi:hypothetical protein